MQHIYFKLSLQVMQFVSGVFVIFICIIRTEGNQRYVNSLVSSSSHSSSSVYVKIANHISLTTKAKTYLRGSPKYSKHQRTNNGLCNHLFPHLIAVPKTTQDVSKIVQISNRYQVPISVRSGGHSFICASIKPGGINIDLRGMNKVQMTTREPFEPPGPALLLGPGSTWERVLNLVPPEKYTMIHGQCTAVGVAGYILGGGYNIIGTSNRYLSGASNVLQYTMVDAEGRILKVSKNNITHLNPTTGHTDSTSDSHGLLQALRLAGSSFGIVTEFHYRIFHEPEVLPAIVLVYIDDYSDLWKFEAALNDGRYHLCLHTAYFFTPPKFDKWKAVFGRMLLKLLPLTQFRKRRPTFVVAVDNFPNPYQRQTDLPSVITFLKKYGMKVALEGPLNRFLQQTFLLYNYESLYQTDEQRKRQGPRPLISNNFGNITTLRSIEGLLLNHPLFGLKNLDSRLSAKSGCEFCYMSIVKVMQSTQPREDYLTLPESGGGPVIGQYNVETVCLYKPNIQSKCPNVVKHAKILFRNSAIKNGEKPTQYLNTPTCDNTNDFPLRYWGSTTYKKLLKTKKFWDPNNVFNYCHSVGSTKEDCCPKDAI